MSNVRPGYLIYSHHDASTLSLHTRAWTIKNILAAHSSASIIVDGDAILGRDKHDEQWERSTLVADSGEPGSSSPPKITVAFKRSLESWRDSSSALAHARQVLTSLGVAQIDSLLLHMDSRAAQGSEAVKQIGTITADIVAAGVVREWSCESENNNVDHLSALLAALPASSTDPRPSHIVLPINLLTLPAALSGIDVIKRRGVSVIAKHPLDLVVSGIPFRCLDLPSSSTSETDRSTALTQASERFNTAINAAINLELAWEKAVWQRAVQLESSVLSSKPTASRQGTQGGGAARIASMPQRDVAWARTIAGNVSAFLGPHASWLLWQHTQYNSVQPSVLRVNAAVMACTTTRGEYEGDPLLSAQEGSEAGTSTDLIALGPKEWVQAYRAAMFETCAALDILVADAHMTRAQEVHTVLDHAFSAVAQQEGASLTAKVLAILLQEGTGISQVCTAEPEAWKIASPTLPSLLGKLGGSMDNSGQVDVEKMQELADKLKDVLAKPME